MQISLNQDEITEAVTKQVLAMISLKPNQKVTVDFTAGRGTNGLTASIEIASTDINSKPTPVTRSVPTEVTTESAEPEPDTATVSDEAPETTDEATPSEDTADNSAEEEAEAPKSIFSKKKVS